MHPLKAGDLVPSVVLNIRENDAWTRISTDQIFKGKTVIAFSLPGAFTPTCSTQYVPRFNELAPVFFKNGVDAVVCIAVNDAFVMDQWAKEQQVEHVTFLPDGNGEFTAKMGLLVDKHDRGFGMRSRRYSMLVKDGVIVKQFIEADAPGDPFEVSDADTMLRFVNPTARPPDQVVIFTREGCTFCAQAKARLNALGHDYIEIALSTQLRTKVIGALSGELTVPQVFINGRRIGGVHALEQWIHETNAVHVDDETPAKL